MGVLLSIHKGEYCPSMNLKSTKVYGILSDTHKKASKIKGCRMSGLTSRFNYCNAICMGLPLKTVKKP